MEKVFVLLKKPNTFERILYSDGWKSFEEAVRGLVNDPSIMDELNKANLYCKVCQGSEGSEVL